MVPVTTGTVLLVQFAALLVLIVLREDRAELLGPDGSLQLPHDRFQLVEVAGLHGRMVILRRQRPQAQSLADVAFEDRVSVGVPVQPFATAQVPDRRVAHGRGRRDGVFRGEEQVARGDEGIDPAGTGRVLRLVGGVLRFQTPEEHDARLDQTEADRPEVGERLLEFRLQLEAGLVEDLADLGDALAP